MKSLLIFLWMAAVSLAQVSSAVLFGDVRDASQSLVSGALLTLRSPSTGFTRTASSGALGEYRIGDLQPGTYTLRIEKSGFRSVAVTGLLLEVNQQARLDVSLQLGEAREEVTVTSQLSPLQTAEPSEGYPLPYPAISGLPLAGRNVISLVTLGPGAIPRQLGGFVHDVLNDLQGARGAVAFNPPVNGARSSMNVHVIDGAYDTNRNTFAIAVTPPLESVQEFRILTSLAPAQAPQAGGAVIDFVSKSGTDRFHGNAFEFLQNETPNARGYFDDPSLAKPVLRQNQFGGSLGGPVGIKSTYFFSTYEAIRGRNAKSTRHIVPDATLRSGDFRNSGPIFDPLSAAPALRTPFAGNRIPTSRTDPIASTFLSRYQPLPNQGGTSYLDSTPSRTDTDNGSARVDHQIRDGSWLFGRYTINDERRELAGSFPELPVSEQLRAQQVVLGHTRSGGSWVNQARLSFTRLRVFNVPRSAFQTNVLRELGIGQAPEDPFNFGLPFFQVTNFEMVTDSPTLPQVQRDNSWNLSDGFSRLRGRHALQFGAQWVYYQFNYLRSQFARGQYIFNGALTGNPSVADSGDAFADFLLGFPQTTRRFSGDAQAYLRNHNTAVYAQDDIRVTRGLTLNLGLRWEYFSPYTDTRGNLLNLDFSGRPSPPALRRSSTGVAPDRNNFAPRLGFAWDLRRVTLRGGYGLYYSPEIAAETYDLARNNQRIEINQTAAERPSLTTRDGFPRTAIAGLPSYFGLDTQARTPYMQQWSLSLQRQLPGKILAEAAYLGTKGTRLGRFRTFNTPLESASGAPLAPRPGDLQTLRPFPQYGALFVRQHISNSVYHSLQLKAEKRFGDRLFFLASFVWAKSIDDSDGIVPGQFDSFGAQDERNLRLERGLSFFDVRRRFSLGLHYRLPHAPFLKPLFSNWETSAVVTLQDGTPLNPVYFIADFANSGTPNRPNVVAGRNVRLPSEQRSVETFFNREAFSDPAPYTFGNAGRNILPGPGNSLVDFGIFRRFTLRESHSIQVRAEAFNLFNHPNFGIPGPYPDFGPFFGRIFASGDQRRLQFGVRYDF